MAAVRAAPVGPSQLRVQIGLTGAVYLNFFTHHFGPDLRYALTVVLMVAFRRAQVRFNVAGYARQMPLLIAFALIGLFVFIAETAATYLGAWVYPHQQQGWQPVHPGKWLAWTLLMVVAFLIVSELKTWEARRAAALSTDPRAGDQNRRGQSRADQAREPAPRAR
ncbi:hypothetical protein DEDE109153_10685 [Deinococcus deserti]